MEISKGILAYDIFLYLKDFDALIISDIHLGYEESLNKQGIYMPKSGYQDLLDKIHREIHNLDKDGFKIKKIILNGDIVHSFSKHTIDEKYILKRFFEHMANYGELIFIKGNHDKILDKILHKEIILLDRLILGNIMIIHGDIIDNESNKKSIRTIIIGHEHPSVTIGTSIREERYKCFLKGKFNGKTLIVMPSANILIEGSDILDDKLLSPYLKNIDKFEVYAIEGDIYDFGKIGSLRK